MPEFYTFPTYDQLVHLASHTPDYMRPNRQPYAVVAEGYLSARDCEDISEAFQQYESYSFATCKAVTREASRPLPSVLDDVVQFTEQMNELWYQYDLDEGPSAWMQTYRAHGDYHMHTDGTPGNGRKLTAVVMLSNPDDYMGGMLRVHTPDTYHSVPRTQGTIVVFPSWMWHDVSSIMAGTRRSLNVGFWGPPFR